MHVTFVNATRKWGGVKTWTLEAAGGLAARGWRVSLFARPGPFLDRALDLGLQARGMDFGCDFHPVRIMDFRGYFLRENVDLVVVNVAKDLRTAGVAARLAGAPVVQRIGLPGDMRDTTKVRALDALIRPVYLCPSLTVRERMLQGLPFIAPERVTAIRTGKAPAEAPVAMPGPDEPVVLVSTSQLKKEKGHAGLLPVLARLKAEGLAWRWEVAGEGPEREALQAQARELGLVDDVNFLGHLADVREVLTRGHVFVLPSRSEGLPNSLLEAMAQGLAPVATDVGGVPEVFVRQDERFLVNRHAGPEAFYRPLRHLLEDRHRLAAQGRIAWQACRELFDARTQLDALDAYFAAVAGGSSRTPGSPA